MPWIIGGAILGGSLVSGFLGNESADASADASREASAASIAEQRRQFDLTRDDYAPWREAGANALTRLVGRLDTQTPGDLPRFQYAGQPPPAFTNTAQLPGYQGGDRFQFDPSRIADNPNYQFVRDSALDAADRVLASQGKFGSGNRVAEIMKLSAGLASNEIGNEFQRQLAASGTNYQRGVTDFGINRQGAMDQYGWNRDAYALNYQQNQDQYQRALGQYGLDYQREADLYGREQNYLNWLSTLSGTGQNATGATANAGANMANAISNINMNNAANQANAAQMKYGAWNSAVQGGINNYMFGKYAGIF